MVRNVFIISVNGIAEIAHFLALKPKNELRNILKIP